MKRHRFDPLAFSAGVVFLVLAVAFGLDALDTWSTNAVWVPPVVFIALGLGSLFTTLARNHQRAEQTADESA
ncbi:MAG TPA: hypothetical protein VFX21_10355 [Acidimicrobiia bacterium]|nr:hypothetical protein [Acidimicrobiia bacterium]